MMEELIARTRFTSQDLFVLLNGYDIDWLVSPPSVTDGGPPADWVLQKWRGKLVRRFAKDGLVDADTNPCPELINTIGPLRNPGLIIDNGIYPKTGRDERTGAVYILPDGRATVALKGSGFFGGWFLRQLHGEHEILEAILAINGLGGDVEVSPAHANRRYIIPSPDPDVDIANLALAGDTASVIRYAEQCGFDPSDFLNLSHWWLEGEGKRIARNQRGMDAARRLASPEGLISSWAFDAVLPGKNEPPFSVHYEAFDYRGYTLLEEDGFTLGTTREKLPHRSSEILPYFGAVASTELPYRSSDKPDDFRADEAEVEIFELYTTKEQLARTLLTIDEYPENGRAVTYEGDDIPLWSYDKMIAEGSTR